MNVPDRAHEVNRDSRDPRNNLESVGSLPEDIGTDPRRIRILAGSKTDPDRDPIRPDSPREKSSPVEPRPDTALKVLRFERYEKIPHAIADRAGPKLLGYAYDIGRWTMRKTGYCHYTTEELSELWDCTPRNARLILGKLETRGVIEWNRRRERTRVIAATPDTKAENFPTEEKNFPVLKEVLTTYNQKQKTEREQLDTVAQTKIKTPAKPSPSLSVLNSEKKQPLAELVSELNAHAESHGWKLRERETPELERAYARARAEGETPETLRAVGIGLFYENPEHRNPDQRYWFLKQGYRLANALKRQETRDRFRAFGEPIIERERIDAEFEKRLEQERIDSEKRRRRCKAGDHVYDVTTEFGDDTRCSCGKLEPEAQDRYDEREAAKRREERDKFIGKFGQGEVGPSLFDDELQRPAVTPANERQERPVPQLKPRDVCKQDGHAWGERSSKLVHGQANEITCSRCGRVDLIEAEAQ